MFGGDLNREGWGGLYLLFGAGVEAGQRGTTPEKVPSKTDDILNLQSEFAHGPLLDVLFVSMKH